jgi:hypothetical protein
MRFPTLTAAVLALSACASPLPPAAAPQAIVPPPFAWNPVCMPPARTGEEILRVQAAADRLLPQLRQDPAFGGARYEHSPCYRFVVGFTDGQPRRWVVDAAEPQLRPYLAFGRSGFSEGERNSAAKQIMAALGAAGIHFAFFMGGIPETFSIYVPTQADVERARLLVPQRYLPITRFHVGVPRRVPERG